MASITTDAPNFGQTLQEIMRPLFYGAPSIANDWCMKKTNFKRKANLPNWLLLDSAIKEPSEDCTFTPTTGNYKLSNRELLLCKWVIELQECTETLLDLFDGEGVWHEDSSPVLDTMPDIAMQGIIWMGLNDMQNNMEPLLWRGKTVSNYYQAACVGWYPQLLAEVPGGQQVTGVVLNATNIVNELNKLIAALPDVVYNASLKNDGRADLKIFVPVEVTKYLAAFYSNQPTGFNADRKGLVPMGPSAYKSGYYFEDIPICPTHGLAPNTMVCTTKQNLWAGLDLDGMAEDQEKGYPASGQQLVVIPMVTTNGDDTYRFKGAFRTGTQVTYPEYASIYLAP